MRSKFSISCCCGYTGGGGPPPLFCHTFACGLEFADIAGWTFSMALRFYVPFGVIGFPVHQFRTISLAPNHFVSGGFTVPRWSSGILASPAEWLWNNSNGEHRGTYYALDMGCGIGPTGPIFGINERLFDETMTFFGQTIPELATLAIACSPFSQHVDFGDTSGGIHGDITH